MTTYNLGNPEHAMKVAEVLQRFVKERNLTVNIKGKNYPLVESWLFAGSQLGLYPVMIEVINMSTETEIKYQSSVEVRRMSDGVVMSRGIAICSNKESSKRLFDEYAICSMAQTRAEGKAFRMLLSWIMKAAGFEATPAEEMDFAKTPEPDSDTIFESERQLLRNLLYQSDLTNDERELAMTAIDLCSDYKRYQQLEIRLESRRAGIDTITNPSQNDIKRHLKKSIK
jgi:hypothetical protein